MLGQNCQNHVCAINIIIFCFRMDYQTPFNQFHGRALIIRVLAHIANQSVLNLRWGRVNEPRNLLIHSGCVVGIVGCVKHR